MKKTPVLKNKKNKAAAQLLQSSGILNIKRFQKKLEALRLHYEKEGFAEAMADVSLPCPFGVFISAGNPAQRAVVMSGHGNTVTEAWSMAAARMEAYLKKTAFETRYVKVDLVDTAQWTYLESVNALLKKSKKSFFRYGLSLDGTFQNAFLEEELNMVRLARYNEHGLSLQRINQYLLEQNRPQVSALPDQVLVFSCQAFFSDEDNSVHTLYSDGFAYGRREIEAVDESLLNRVLTTAGTQLANMVEKTGKFKYGYFADMNEKIPTYNIVRHAAAIWALLMQYGRKPDPMLKEKIDHAIEFFIRTAVEETETTAFLAEHSSNEIKLGANAVAVISLVTYAEIMQDEKYIPLAKKLAEGILLCQEGDGGYWHILSHPEKERKEKYRIVYYDGEATFALAKLYGLTKEEKWLQAAEKAVRHFIREDYTRYTDHWVAYSVNEVTKYVPDPSYFEFALKNVTNNISRIYRQDTSYHTFLELLMASFETLLRIKAACPHLEGLRHFEESQLIKTIYYRAQHMLAGYLYPEYAMYLKKPALFIGSFCVRHHNFRVRIDDIEHFMGGYYHMLKHFDALEEARKRCGIEAEDYMTLQG